MGVTQSNYPERAGVARAGNIANTHTSDIDSYVVQTAGGVGFGRAVQRHASIDDRIIIGHSATKFLGIAVADPTVPESQGGSHTEYAQHRVAAVCYRGDIWVEVSAAVTAGSQASAVGSTGIFGSGVDISGALYLDDAVADGLARVRLNGTILG